MPDTRSNNAEEVVISRLDEAQRNRLAEIDKQIAHCKEIVDPLADAYFSLLAPGLMKPVVNCWRCLPLLPSVC